MNPDSHDLIQRHMAGLLTEDESTGLQTRLKADTDLRRLYLHYMNLDVALEAQAGAHSAVTEMLVSSTHAESRRRTGWLSWRPLAAVAALVFAALIGTVIFTADANASSVKFLQRAMKAQSAGIDRCYRVELRHNAGKDGQPRSLPGEDSAETRLWTRGDRFWVEMRAGNVTTAWGRDERGRVWLAQSPNLGAFLDQDEVKAHLALSSGLRELQLEALLGSILADFDLHREPGSVNGQIIHAELKAGRENPRYRSALLEVDVESGVLRRLTLDGLRDGPAAVTLTHAESALHDAANYTLEGHLAPHAVIYHRHHEPDKRDALFARLFSALVPTANAKQ
jgi:hypothetical protein